MKQNIDLNRVQIYVKIVEAGNITRAAEQLNEPKAKLSRNLALLEQELGVQLVYRTTRQFRLTEAGLQFYENSKANIEALSQAVSRLQAADEDLIGTITLTAPDDIGLLVVTQIVNEFTKMYPKVGFRLIYSHQLLDLVKLGVDVAIRVGNLKDSSLIQKKAGNVKMILAASPKYLNKARMPTTVDQIVSHQCIGFSSQANSQVWSLHSQTGKKSIKLNYHMTANNYIAVRDLLLQGQGIGFLPRFLCEQALASGELIHILKQWGEEGLPIQVAMPHQKNISIRVRTFVDFAVKKIGEIF